MIGGVTEDSAVGETEVGCEAVGVQQPGILIYLKEYGYEKCTLGMTVYRDVEDGHITFEGVVGVEKVEVGVISSRMTLDTDHVGDANVSDLMIGNM